MTDLDTLLAKIRTLPKRRIAEVEDFVDFLALRGSTKPAKPEPSLEEMMWATEKPNRARHGRPPLSPPVDDDLLSSHPPALSHPD